MGTGSMTLFRDKTMNTPRKKEVKVDIGRVLEFLFPPGLQHPLVAGRLIAYGMYGPLDDNLCLHSGEKGEGGGEEQSNEWKDANEASMGRGEERSDDWNIVSCVGWRIVLAMSKVTSGRLLVM